MVCVPPLPLSAIETKGFVALDSLVQKWALLYVGKKNHLGFLRRRCGGLPVVFFCVVAGAFVAVVWARRTPSHRQHSIVFVPTNLCVLRLSVPCRLISACVLFSCVGASTTVRPCWGGRGRWRVFAGRLGLIQADHPQLVSDILDIVGNSVTVTPIELPEAGAADAAAVAAADNQVSARRRWNDGTFCLERTEALNKSARIYRLLLFIAAAVSGLVQ